MKSFSHNLRKIKKAQYVLTPKGLRDKLNLTYYFLKRKEKEYLDLKRELEKISIEEGT